MSDPNDILALLYGELPSDAEASLRAELEQDEEARQVYDALSQGKEFADRLPMVEVPDDLSARVLAAVSAETARPSESDVAVSEAEESFVERSLRWLRAFAAGPQAAMATVMMLVAALGFWYLPRSADEAPASEEIVATDTTAASPSASLGVPGEIPEGQAAPTLPSDGAYAGVGNARLEADQSQGSSQGSRRRVATPRTSGRAGNAAEARMAAPSSIPAAPEAEQVAAADAFRGNMGRGSAGGAPSPSPIVAAGAEAGDDAPDADESDPRFDMVRRRAESFYANSDYRSAANEYERWLSDNPRAQNRGAIMLKAADAYRRAGQIDRARAWLERAERIPSVRLAARRELLRINAPSAMRARRSPARAMRRDEVLNAPASTY